MDLNSVKRVFFLGIGGIGMSAIARFFKSKGIEVYGYDKTPTILTSNLLKEGIEIHFDDNIKNIPDNIDLYIYTPAIPSDNNEFKYLKENNIKLYKRSEVLRIITQKLKAIAIAGTHGKTTISTLTAHILKQSSFDCNAFLGGISKNYNTNLLLSERSDYVVIEADEYDKSFLNLSPYFASISSIDADHLDIYGDKLNLSETFNEFANKVQKDGKLFIKKGLEIFTKVKKYSYSLTDKSDFYADNIRLTDDCYFFDVNIPKGSIKNLKMYYPGLHNIENAVVSIAIAKSIGVNDEVIRKALESFKGVYRRFDIRIKNDKFIYIDDYAHHPEEIKACINSVRNFYKGKKITGIFQPHLYSRTRDFVEEFAKSLELLDCIILLDIYPAREKPIEGVSSEILLKKIKNTEKFLLHKDDIPNFIKKRKLEILLTMGAGDIDQLVQPIEKLFMKD